MQQTGMWTLNECICVPCRELHRFLRTAPVFFFNQLSSIFEINFASSRPFRNKTFTVVCRGHLRQCTAVQTTYCSHANMSAQCLHRFVHFWEVDAELMRTTSSKKLCIRKKGGSEDEVMISSIISVLKKLATQKTDDLRDDNIQERVPRSKCYKQHH